MGELKTYKLRKLGEHESLNSIETNTNEENVSDVIETTATGTSSALTEVERVQVERVTSEDTGKGEKVS